jgi:hypothetical protein
MPSILTNINLNKNELQNAAIHKLSAPPASPTSGQLYYDTDDNHLYFYTGSAWFDVTNALTLAGNAETLYARLASPTFTGTPAAPTAAAGTNTTQVATTAYVVAEIAARLASNDAMLYKGAIDASANPNYPAGDAGDTYRISVAGKIGGASGPNVEVGDLIILHVDGSAAGTHAAVGANWDIIQTNIDGAVTLDGTQTLTNKTINLSNNTLSGTTAQFNTALSDGDFATLAGSETLTNKTLTTPTIASFTNAQHTHTNAAGGGTLAEAALALTDITTNNATTGRHGFLPKLSNNAAEFLNGTGVFSTPAGSGVAKFAQTVGDGVATSFVITHNLGTRSVAFSIAESATPWATVLADVEFTSTNTATVRFAVAPTTNQYNVTFVG